VPQLAEELPHRPDQILSIFEVLPTQPLAWHLQEVLDSSPRPQQLTSLAPWLLVPAGVTGSVVLLVPTFVTMERRPQLRLEW